MLLLTLLLTTRLPAHRAVGAGRRCPWGSTTLQQEGGREGRVGLRRDWELAFTSAALGPGPPGWRRGHTAGPQRWLPSVLTLA